jgi:hypothetical protein
MAAFSVLPDFGFLTLAETEVSIECRPMSRQAPFKGLFCLVHDLRGDLQIGYEIEKMDRRVTNMLVFYCNRLNEKITGGD